MAISTALNKAVKQSNMKQGLRRVAILVLAIGLWIGSLARIDTEALGELGLINALPITYFVAIGLLIVSFFIELFSPRRASQKLLAAHLITLVFFLHGTAPLIFPEARYAWTYKHFGVTEHIDWFGTVSPTSDIYQNWPGFFAFSSWFERVGGISNPRDYAAWAQVFFNLIYMLELAFVFRMLTTNKQVMWIAMIIFGCASWVGQDYFAPQAFVYVIVLALYGLILRWLVRLEPKMGLSRFVLRFVPVRSDRTPEDLPVWHANRVQRGWAVAGTALMFFVLTFSHQLTPYMMLSGLALLTLFGAMANRMVLVIFAAIAFFYLLPHLTFIIDHYGLLSGFDPLANAKNQTVQAARNSGGHVFVAMCARYLSFLVWLLAIAGAIRRLFYGRRELVAVLLMVCPLVIMMGQSYGGEAIYRVYLFSLPWAAYLAAQAIVPLGKNRIALRSLRTAVPVLAMTALILPTYFGLERVSQIRTGEVDAAEYFYANARPGSVMLGIEPNFPAKLAGNYDQFQHPGAGDLSGFARQGRTVDMNTVTPEQLQTILEGMIEATPAVDKYVALSKSQTAYSKVFGTLPPNSVPNLAARLAKAPKWKVWLHNNDAVIYEYVP